MIVFMRIADSKGEHFRALFVGGTRRDHILASQWLIATSIPPKGSNALLMRLIGSIDGI
jgi:hypothetical protein